MSDQRGPTPRVVWVDDVSVPWENFDKAVVEATEKIRAATSALKPPKAPTDRPRYQSPYGPPPRKKR